MCSERHGGCGVWGGHRGWLWVGADESVNQGWLLRLERAKVRTEVLVHDGLDPCVCVGVCKTKETIRNSHKHTKQVGAYTGI